METGVKILPSFKILLLFYCSQLAFVAVAQDTIKPQQIDIIDIFNKKHKSNTEFPRLKKNKLTFSILPDQNSTRKDEFFITPIFACFYLGDIKETKISSVTFAPYFTFSGKYVFPVRAFIYTWKNRYNLGSDYRYMVYSQKAYPLGTKPTKEEQSTIYYHQYRFHQFISKKIIKNLFLGGGVQLDNYYNIREENTSPDSSDYSKLQLNGSTASNTNGLSLQLMYDTRQNNINATSGFLARTTVRFNTSWMNSTQVSNSMFTEFRKFISFHPQKHRVLALWSIYWTNLYGKPYYLDLPSIGWDITGNSGRGVYKNSMRSNALLFFESEYRTDLTKNGLWGAVCFVNVTSASVYNSQKFREWYPATGIGLRLKWNKRYGGNLRLDVGFSKYYISAYVGVAENF